MKTQSKDPFHAFSEIDLKGSSHDAACLVVESLWHGSFDCIAVRFADGNSAQDDRHEWL
jgi:hypothetical protein